ncbi:hypothetical protein RCH11_001676 [Glaciihabitans sp. GrIS 2.15]|nr:hypothetical protein [Glaciihabitans sp. GrIS 2.15]
MVIAVVAIVQAQLARRPKSSDLSRVNGLECRDERDRLLARAGFSVGGGGLAPIASVVDAMAARIVRSVNPGSGPSQGSYWVASAQLMLFIWVGAARTASPPSKTDSRWISA